MGLVISGIIIAVLGVVFWVLKSNRESKAASLQLMETTTIKDVMENYISIKNSMGAGSFKNYVELKGQSSADNPLISEFSEEKIVYSHAEVYHVFEEEQLKSLPDGKKEKEWMKKSERITQHKVWSPDFGITDGSGTIKIQSDHAQLYTTRLFDKFEPVSGTHPKMLKGQLGRVISEIKEPKGRRTLGYRYTESGIRLGAELYVVGTANDLDGELVISKPKNDEEEFIVSTKSKSQFVGKLGNTIKILNFMALFCGALGVGLFLYGLISKLI